MNPNTPKQNFSRYLDVQSHLLSPENQTVPTNYADMHSPSLVSTLLLISGIKPRNEPKHPKTKFKQIFRCTVSPASPREPNSPNQLCSYAPPIKSGIKQRHKSEQQKQYLSRCLMYSLTSLTQRTKPYQRIIYICTDIHNGDKTKTQI